MLAINNFGRETVSIVCAKKLWENGRGSLGITHNDEGAGKKPSFYGMVFHICKVKKLMTPLVSVAIIMSLLEAICALL
jgi:hypothetical protein